MSTINNFHVSKNISIDLQTYDAPYYTKSCFSFKNTKTLSFYCIGKQLFLNEMKVGELVNLVLNPLFIFFLFHKKLWMNLHTLMEECLIIASQSWFYNSNNRKGCGYKYFVEWVHKTSSNAFLVFLYIPHTSINIPIIINKCSDGIKWKCI